MYTPKGSSRCSSIVEVKRKPKFELLSKVDMLFCYLSLLFLKNTSFL
jgi:hypothetical protein